MKPHFDVIVPGHYFCDLIFSGLPGFPALGEEIYVNAFNAVPGGGALNTSIALQRLGIRVGWVGTFGNDFFSRYIREQLEREGMDLGLCIQYDQPLRRVTAALSYPSDRMFVSFVDDAPDLMDRVFELLDKATFDHLHFPGLDIAPRVSDLIRKCHELGVRVSMDSQHREVTLDSPMVRDVLTQVDIFTPNAAEAKRITQTSSIPEALDVLEQIIPLVIIKNGAEGACARHKGTTYIEPALELTPFDTTGAGDAFNGGFIAALVKQKSLPDCLKWGNFCGGMSTLGFGGFAAPTQAQLDEWLSTK